MSNEDDLKQLREFWKDFVKWTVGISIFLITASLTILSFQKCAVDIYNRVTVYSTTGFLILSIILSWLLLKLNISVLKTKMEFQEKWSTMVSPEKQVVRDKEEKEYNKKLNWAKPLEKWITVTFILGVVSFIAYLITYIH